MPALDVTPVVAHLSTLEGLKIPRSLRATLQERGLVFAEAEPSSVLTSEALAFPLIWVGRDWERGLGLLATMPDESAEVRKRSVLIGESPPADVGHRIRQLGALTYALAEFPSWLLEPIAEAQARLAALRGTAVQSASQALLGKGVQRDIDKLLAVSALAATALNADSVSILIREGQSTPVRILIGREGALQVVRWSEGCPTDPSVFFDHAERFTGHVTYPCLEHARSIPNETAIALPHHSALATRLDDGAGMQCAMLVLWARPYLLTANEVVSLDSLCFVARKAWVYTQLALVGLDVPAAAGTQPLRDSRLPPPEARLDAVLRNVADFMGVPGTLLVLRDREETPERLFYAAEWLSQDLRAFGSAHRGLYCACPRQSFTWAATLRACFAELGVPLEVLDLMLLPAAEDGLPQGALVLLGGPRSEPRGENIQGLLMYSAAQEILRVAWQTFELDERTRAEADFDQLPSRAHGTMSDLLRESAQLIHRATRADQVFLKFGREYASDPKVDDAVRVGVGERSVTRLAKREDKCIRLLNIYDEERETAREVDHASLAKLLSSLDWTKLRSMIVCPFAGGLGIIKVYTHENGAFLTASDAKLVRTLAERLGQVAGRVLRWEALHDLNVLASDIAGLAGAQLAREIVARLEKWTAQFIRPECQLLLRARDAHGATVLEGVSASMTQATRTAITSGANTQQLVRVPLALQQALGLTGELCLWHARPLPRSASDYVKEAAREISIVLYAEHVRHEAREQFGILRHGVLGPLQGLVSQANLLKRQAGKSEHFGPEMQECVRTILDETNNIAEWNVRHRLFASFRVGGRLDVRPQRGELRPFVENCARRFQEAMNHRGLTLRLIVPTGGVLAEFDEFALDAALSNLCDNAVKYAFYNREVTVGIDTRGRSGFLGIWVEDVGHGIPSDRAELIYAPGGRAGQFDPLRVIHGEGLGLYIARAIARAHDGDLTHTVKAESRSVHDKTPYRVRFTLSIPWS